MTCVAKGVDVGLDANGKVLTSLVMVPGEAPVEKQQARRAGPDHSLCFERP